MTEHENKLESKDFINIAGKGFTEDYSVADFNAIGASMIGDGSSIDRADWSIAAGYTYLGQFIDHDITHTNGEENRNTAQLDLDSLYPKNENDTTIKDGKFLLGDHGGSNIGGDLRRDINFHAMIPDHRNDENIIIASIHLTFQKFHNILVNQGNSFNQAKVIVMDHYHAIVAYDFVRKLTDLNQDQISNIIDRQEKRFIYTEDMVRMNGGPFIPTEFSGACYRFGHTMVRSNYDFNDNFSKGTLSKPPLFFGFPGGRPDFNLVGSDGKPFPTSDARSHKITSVWVLSGTATLFEGGKKLQSLERFFEKGKNKRNSAGVIDTNLSDVMGNLQVSKTAKKDTVLTDIDKFNIASRNLQRGQSLGLVSGQEFAQFVKEKSKGKVNPLSDEKIQEVIENLASRSEEKISDALKKKLISNTPLWLYTLAEAEAAEVGTGARLGPIASRCVAEVILGLLMDDTMNVDSIRNTSQSRKNAPYNLNEPNEPNKWKSSIIQNKEARDIEMLDIIKFVNKNHNKVL
ncbi:MAG: hypothetical protein HAW61_03265 [Candidatus Portiera sp.]|nr:hypothetical protein [Portiera sp.]